MKKVVRTIDELLEHARNLEEPIRYSRRRTGRSIMVEKMYKAQYDYNTAVFRLQNLMQKTTFAEHIEAYE